MKHKWLIGLLALGTIAFAQTVAYKLSINGRSYSSNAIVVKGETFVVAHPGRQVQPNLLP